MGFRGGSSQLVKSSILAEREIYNEAQQQNRTSLVGWSVVTYNGWQYRGFYDDAKKIVIQKEQLDSDGEFIEGTLQEVVSSKSISDFDDDHKFITLKFFGPRLFCFWGMHGNPLQFARATTDEGITLGATETVLSSIPTAAYDSTTYVMCWDNPVNSDEVFVYLRDGGSGNAKSRLFKYTISTDTFVDAPGTQSNGEFFTDVRSGGTASMYTGMPWITPDGLALFMYHIRIDSGDNNKNTDVNFLIYDMVNGEFRKSTGEVYTNSIQFDAATSSRAPEKLVDISTTNLLGTDYIRRQNVRLKDGTDCLVYQTKDSKGFRNVFFLKGKDGVWNTPKQLTFYRAADNDTTFRNFINPALYTRDGILYCTFKSLHNYSMVGVIESSDKGNTWTRPYAITNNAGRGTLQNMDFEAWTRYGKFYALTQPAASNYQNIDWNRAMNLLRWNPSEDQFLPFIQTQGITTLGDLILESYAGNVQIIAGKGEAIYVTSPNSAAEVFSHKPTKLAGSETVIQIMRITIDGISPARSFCWRIERPSVINGGVLPSNVPLFDFSDADAGTHEAIDGGTTHATLGAINAWIPIWYKDAGVDKFGYIPILNSKT